VKFSGISNKKSSSERPSDQENVEPIAQSLEPGDGYISPPNGKRKLIFLTCLWIGYVI